jgi:hypothetical protein
VYFWGMWWLQMAEHELQQQLYYKQNEFLNHLQRIGKIELPI